MILTIDIGNTSTKFGVYEEDALVSRLSAPTIRTHTAADISQLVKIASPVRAVIISSVVSDLKETYRKFSIEHLETEPIFVDSSFDLNLKIRYAAPETLGVDRLVAAFAAVEKYGKPCIVCDFGTATTIDVVNSNGEFLGGIITPGMETMRDSLFRKTSALPLVEIRRPERVIGDSTVQAIQSGIYFGYVALVDGLIERMKSELGEQARVAATGGWANLLAGDSRKIETVDDNLMLDGLRLIYEKFR